MKKIYNKFLSKAGVRGRQKEQRPATTQKSSEDYGLKLVHDEETATIDVVAIHGHGGHWRTSWTDRDSGTFWLADLLPKINPNIRVLSYGYDASNASTQAVEDIASSLLAELVLLRRNTSSTNRPLLFVAHSFGGLLLKGALGMDIDGVGLSDASETRSSTNGILFFGVPKNAEDAFGNLGQLAMQEENPTDSPLIKSLKRDVRWLQATNSRYSETTKDLPVTYFIESANGEVIKPLVESTNSSSFDTTTRVYLSKTHGGMVRFPGAEDGDFQKVSKCLALMMPEASED